jgi:hypothetical protein
MPEILAHCKLLAVEFYPHHLRNVSGVTVEQFLSVIAPYFSKLTVPTLGRVLNTEEFVPCLSRMYEADQGDENILFEKDCGGEGQAVMAA